MDRFTLLAPALVTLSALVAAFVVYCALCALGHAPRLRAVKHNELIGPFFAGFLVWVLGPLERLLVGRVSPNAVTSLSLLLCAITGLAAALGHLGGAVWLYAVAGILDVLDGRLARLGGKQTKAGALFDSVSDRWGELFVFSGYAWYLHASPWMLAVLAAVGASMMVSYTRARAEGLGIQLAGGMMQRAERIVLVSFGGLAAAYASTDATTAYAVDTILGGTMLACAAASTATAINRWIVAFKDLAQREAEPLTVDESLVDQAPMPLPQRPAIAARHIVN